MSAEAEDKGSEQLQREVIFSTIWDILKPPPAGSKKALIPRPLVKMKHRKLSLEVHKVCMERHDGPYEYEDCVVRLWMPDKSTRPSLQIGMLDPSNNSDDDDDDNTNSNTPVELLNAGAPLPELAGSWKPKYQVSIGSLVHKQTTGSRVFMRLNQDGTKEKREFVFQSAELANEFTSAFNREKIRESKRLDKKLKGSLGDIKLKKGEKLDLLIEVCSGWTLPVADVTSSDPFVVCSINGKEVHRTHYIPKTLNPIWTVQTGSLFILNIDSKELFAGDGLFCRVVDYDVISSDDLGMFVVPPDVLYKANGEREVFKLRPPPRSNKEEVPGDLAIRCRRATLYDKEFMKEFAQAAAKADTAATLTAGGQSDLKSILGRNEKTDKTGMKKFKMRPAPDPKRPEETEWMTEDEIEYEYLKESQHWIDSGSGKIGKIFFEILGCDGLPNLDTGGFLGNKTDAFVSLVYEDSVAQTDIIDDCLSPRWLPWTKRAFVFHMTHSSSQVLLGVFDNDTGMDDHDLIGKVSIDLTNFKKDTIYTLKYDIFKSSQMSSRKAKGSVTLRLRLEIEDERKLLLACLEPPPDVYVNVKSRKEFRVVRWTCSGKYDMEQYSMKVMNSYIEELLAYQQLLFYVEDSIISLLMWRPQSHFTVMGKEFGIPTHSIIAFVCFASLVEKPQFLPSFFFFSVAWFLIAVMSFRRQAPNPWNRCKSFAELCNMLVLGKSMAPPDLIKPQQNINETRSTIDEWQKRMVESEERAKKAYEDSLKAQEAYEKDMAEIGEAKTDISTKAGGVSVDIFKPIFFPIQKNLAMVCRTLRFMRAVVLWDECYFTFWITMLSVVFGVAFLFVPWLTILRWSARFTVWSIFGPWMKLVDVHYYSRIQPLSEDELEERDELQRLQRQELTSKAATANRIKRENAAKLRDIKKFMFGNFISRVPILKADRHRDAPLSDSQAIPYVPKPLDLADLAMKEAGYRRTRLPGQHLEGDMIPRVESVAFTDAPLGRATAKPNLLDKESPGGSAPAVSESTATVYAKLVSVVATAGVVTWVGVPLLSKATEVALSWLS